VAPGESIPAHVSDLQTWGKAEGIYLRWSMPSRNLDGTRLEDFLGFRVFRQERLSADSSCPDCPMNFEPVAEIDVEFPKGPVQIQGDQVMWRDPNVKIQREYVYFVMGYNVYGTPSPESNRTKISWDDPPAAPESAQVRSEDQALEVTWSYMSRLVSGKEMKGLAGFNLYRRTETERFSFFPLNPQPVPGNQYLDGALENERRYFYQVRAVRSVRGTLIEGAGSAVVSGVPEKRNPPSPPTGLVTARQADGVALRWNLNPEPDVAGYNLYRREIGAKESLKLNPQLISERYFLDTTADPRKSYEYTLTAVDTTGKESAPSQPADAEAMAPPSKSDTAQD
jgi:uncharacterized protein